MKSYETEPRQGMPSVEVPLEDAQGSSYDATEEEDLLVDDAANSPDSALPDVHRLTVPGYESVEAPLEDDQQPRRRSFSLPSREQLLRWVPFWGVILLGAVLRFWGLGDKPLHHDESLHAYYSMVLMHQMENWIGCFNPPPGQACFQYDPLIHGPFQFHIIALVYKISQILGVYDNGINTYTVRFAAATLGTAIVGLPYFLRDYLGKIGAWLACLLLAVSPSMVYFSRFAREDIYMACFTLLMVVAIARYVRSRKMRWLIIGAVAFSLSYATKEATFLTVAVFGSFLGGLLAWELGLRWPLRSRFSSDSPFAARLPHTAAPITLLAYLVIAGIAAKIFFGWIQALSIYVTNNPDASNAYVQGLKDNTVAVVPWIGIALGIYVLITLGREMYGKLPPEGRRGLAAWIDPEKQRIFDTILTMPWTHWFFAILSAWAVFLVLFTILFTNIKGGIGDGIWQGLYYWLEQQQVARGSQPWYYYLMLIPLYEQIGVVFGLIGLVRCLLRPTRFRLFLAYWFVGNVLIYSWAAEKMPWLMIHMTMPMLLLAAVGLEPVVVTLIEAVKSRFARPATAMVQTSATNGNLPVLAPRPRSRISVLTAVTGAIFAVLLLLPTLHNMYEVSYVHAADGPHEMMVYVQTTTDVNIVMAKIDALDQKLYGGKHLLSIGVMNDAVWPFVWYVRDYPNTCLYYPGNCPQHIEVIISGGDNLYSAETQYGGKGAEYMYHQYHMRTWWDEGYKPPPCVPTKTDNCAGQPAWGGVGPGLWLSYGDNPPPNAKFNLSLAAEHIWQWWWNRTAIGDTGGTYDMGLFIRKDLGTLVTP